VTGCAGCRRVVPRGPRAEERMAGGQSPGHVPSLPGMSPVPRPCSWFAGCAPGPPGMFPPKVCGKPLAESSFGWHVVPGGTPYRGESRHPWGGPSPSSCKGDVLLSPECRRTTISAGKPSRLAKRAVRGAPSGLGTSHELLLACRRLGHPDRRLVRLSCRFTHRDTQRRGKTCFRPCRGGCAFLFDRGESLAAGRIRPRGAGRCLVTRESDA